MIILKTEQEIEKMKAAGVILANVHKEIAKMIKPGISTMDIDRFVEEYLKEHKNVHLLGDAEKVGNLKTVIWGAYDLAFSI